MQELHLASNLKKYREQSGIRPSELAESIGIAREQIWCYENGQRIPSVPILAMLAQKLNVSVDILLWEV